MRLEMKRAEMGEAMAAAWEIWGNRRKHRLGSSECRGPQRSMNRD
jgi:hypothetical protein